MNSTFESLARFLESIVTLTFWRRVFRWSNIRALSYSAYEEYKSLLKELSDKSAGLEETKLSLALKQNEIDHLKQQQSTMERELRSSLANQLLEISQLKLQADRLAGERNATERDIAMLRQAEQSRREDHERKVATLGTIQQRVLDERKAEQDERATRDMEKLRRMKESWSRHQIEVKSEVKRICQKHAIEYVENVPFKGTPDNAIMICGEFVVFDAKSPGGEDLGNFPQYIKAQTESVRKYAKEEGVRKELFLVVPPNTLDVLEQTCFNMAEYNVFVISLDSLEPIILSLKRLEDYEFVDQLTPEERDDICRLIGKFAHAAKRRIQIDHYFAWEFLDVLTKCKTSLPREMMERVLDYERAEKLNPPQERRTKQILTRDLESDAQRIQKEAEAKAIIFPPSLGERIKGLPLFEPDEQ